MYVKMQATGFTESIPFICISAIWGQYPASWFYYILQFLAHCREWLMAAGSQALSWGPPGSEMHIWMLEITDGCNIFVYWHGRRYPISQYFSSSFELRLPVGRGYRVITKLSQSCVWVSAKMQVIAADFNATASS